MTKEIKTSFKVSSIFCCWIIFILWSCVQTGILVPAHNLIVSNSEFYAKVNLKNKALESTGPINFGSLPRYLVLRFGQDTVILLPILNCAYNRNTTDLRFSKFWQNSESLVVYNVNILDFWRNTEVFWPTLLQFTSL